MQKTKKQQRAIIKGVVAVVVGLMIGMAYLFKWFPFNPTEHMAILAAWAYVGWMIPAIILLYGLCLIFLEGDL